MFIVDAIYNPIFLSFVALFIGSFLNVCIFRLPYGRPKGLASLEMEEEEVEEVISEEDKKINVMFPKRSFCPECKKQLLWWHNIPLISYLILRRKCHFCKVKIPFRYPFVEFLSLFFGLLCYYSFTPWTALVVYIFCCALIVISFIDIDYYIIPNVITFPGVAIGLVLAAVNNFTQIFDAPLVPGLKEAGFGLLVGGGFLYAVAEIYYRVKKKVGLGFGDVKLMALAGVFFGWTICLQAIFVGSLLGTVIGGGQLILSRKGTHTPIPFGPYLALGILVCVFVGPENITRWFVIGR